jgi:hypothetical protein
MIRGKEENQSNWWLTVEHIGRELRKFYPPVDVPPGLHTLFIEERRKAAAMQQNHQESDDSKDDRHSK